MSSGLYDLISVNVPQVITEQFPLSLSRGRYAVVLTSSHTQSLPGNDRLMTVPQCRPRRGHVPASLPLPMVRTAALPGDRGCMKHDRKYRTGDPTGKKKSPCVTISSTTSFGTPQKGLFLIAFRTGVSKGVQRTPVELLPVLT